MNEKLIEVPGCPARDELFAASAILGARPDLALSPIADEIVMSEYSHYSSLTYVFEVIGFQLLGEMASRLRRFDFVHELASQSQDEARHAHLYREVVETLPMKPSAASIRDCAARIYDAFVAVGTIEEKVVTAYFVLESVAVGIFAARQQHYRTSPLARVDHEILVDEARHQGMGVRITSSLVEGGRLTVEDVNEIVRGASETVGRLLQPTDLFQRFDVGQSPNECQLVLSSGFLGTQRTASRKAMLSALRRLRRQLDEREEDPRAFAA